MIRDSSGAHGASASLNESGFLSLYSFKDPNCESTYDTFEMAITEICEGKFSDGELDQAKIAAFSRMDKVLDPSLKGLLNFTRGYDDEHRLKTRLRAIDISKQEIT